MNIVKLFLVLFSFQLFANERLYGVTVDDVSKLSQVVQSIKSLPKRLTVRIVFDEDQQPQYYKAAVDEIGKYADIMGEILDSYYVKDFSFPRHQARVKAYVDYFGSKVKIWEIGNEVNGEWLLPKYNNVESAILIQKLSAAYSYVKSKGFKTALTLYYNGDWNGGNAGDFNCWSHPKEHMQTWARSQLPNEMKLGLDYVFVSFYEDDCEGIKPKWQDVFKELAVIFPKSKLGIGECGSHDPSDTPIYLKRYYQDLTVNLPQFVYGGFWWFFNRDMVPMNKVGWSQLRDILKRASF